MSTILIASSPVEIEAKADDGSIEPEARTVAVVLFHELTNRIGEAVIKYSDHHENWPHHCFYLGKNDARMEALIGNLVTQKGLVDVTEAVSPATETPDGLFVWAIQKGYVGVMVASTKREI